MILEFPCQFEEKHLLILFEEYLKKKPFEFSKKKNGGVYNFTVTINEPLDAFWIGCNLIFITNA